MHPGAWFDFRRIEQVFLANRAKYIGGGAGAGSMHVTTAVLDVLSPLLTIVSPPLRPVNFGLLNTREKADTRTLIQARRDGWAHAAALGRVVCFDGLFHLPPPPDPDQTLVSAGLTFAPKAVVAKADVPAWKRRLRSAEGGADEDEERVYALQP